MSQPRRIMPLPLGGEHGLPYSRGLMARALMAVGVAPDRAYALARRVGDDLASRGSDVVLTPGEDFTLRLRPLEPLEGRVAVFTTGPAPTGHLDADVVHVSRNLARRDLLVQELSSLDADTYLVELKAAAIDVVAEHALARGARIVLADNEVVAPGLDERILALLPQAVRM